MTNIFWDLKQNTIVLFAAALVLAFSGVAGAAARNTKTVLPNGLTLIVNPVEGSGIVAVNVFVKAGVDQERDYNAGIGAFVARALLASTINKRAETVAGVVDWAGGNVQTVWTQDYTEVKAVVTKSRFNETMNLIGDVLINANFETKWVEQIRQDIYNDINTDTDDIFQSTYKLLQKRLYKDSPYGRPSYGYVRSIKGISSDDLAAFYAKYYVPNNIVISVAGDVTPEAVENRAKIAFAGTSYTSLPKQKAVPSEGLTETFSETVTRPCKAAYFMFGFLAPGAVSKEYPAAMVAVAALGDGKGSRMFRELRDKKSLAYELGTLYPVLRNQSHAIAYMVTDLKTSKDITREQSVNQTKQAMLDEIARMKTDLITPQELERAKHFTIGKFMLGHQRMKDKAFYPGMYEAIGLGSEFDSTFADKIEAVTAEDVRSIMRKYFTNYSLIVVLPQEN